MLTNNYILPVYLKVKTKKNQVMYISIVQLNIIFRKKLKHYRMHLYINQIVNHLNS